MCPRRLGWRRPPSKAAPSLEVPQHKIDSDSTRRPGGALLARTRSGCSAQQSAQRCSPGKQKCRHARRKAKAGPGPAADLVSQFATNAHVARRRWIGPRLLAALTERREAASTKAVTAASTPGLPLQASTSSPPSAIPGGCIHVWAVASAHDRFGRDGGFELATASATYAIVESRRDCGLGGTSPLSRTTPVGPPGGWCTLQSSARPQTRATGTRLGLLQCAVHGLAGHAEVRRDLSDGAVPTVIRLPSQLDLPGRELRLLPAGPPAGSGGGQTIHRALAHERVLKLADSADDLKEQSPNRGRRVDPLVEHDQVDPAGLKEL